MKKSPQTYGKPAGQGQGLAIKIGVPSLDAVLHKGKLCCGELLAVEVFVSFQIQPLAEAELQNEIILRAAAAVQHRGSGIV